MGRFKVSYSDGESVEVNTDGGEPAAKKHAEALEAERVGKAIRAGIQLAPRGLRPDVEVLKADKEKPEPKAKAKA